MIDPLFTISSTSAEVCTMDSPLSGNAPGFTGEQKEYLSGFFSGAMQRAALPFVGLTSSGQFTDDASLSEQNLASANEPAVHGTPVSDLSREELWKFEQNPLDIWEKLISCADSNRAPDAEDIFRFKYHGLFYVAPAQDSFMLR